MSYVYYNPNPLGLSVGDCTIRAISRALNLTWEQTYNALARQGFEMCDMPSVNRVWGTFLKQQGFKKYQMPDLCHMLARKIHIVWAETHTAAAWCMMLIETLICI